MKSVPNRTFTVPMDDKKTPATTATLLAVLINRPPHGGFTLQVMRERNRLLEVTEKATDGGVLKFEDNDYKAACELAKAATWPIYHKDLLAFSEQFGA